MTTTVVKDPNTKVVTVTTGSTGPQGLAATVTVGTVTTGAAGKRNSYQQRNIFCCNV